MASKCNVTYTAHLANIIYKFTEYLSCVGMAANKASHNEFNRVDIMQECNRSMSKSNTCNRKSIYLF